MECKDFSDKVYRIDDLSPEEFRELKEHLKQCDRNHEKDTWILDDLSFNTPAPGNPQELTTNIMQAVAAAGKPRGRQPGKNLLRYAAAITALVLTTTFALEITRSPRISYQEAGVLKRESNATFIKRIRRQPKATNLIAEIRACRTQCLNPVSEGCEACIALLTNLNRNPK